MSRHAKVWQGGAADLPIATFVRPSGSVPAVYGAADTIAAAVYQSGVAAPIFTPTAAWYTNSGVQTGYDQGEVLVSWGVADAGKLQAGVQYNLIVTWSPATSPTESAPIASIPITVRRNNAQ